MIKTKGVDLTPPSTVDFIKSMIEPGANYLTIHRIELKKNGEFGDKLTFFCETEPVTNPSFKGLAIDKNDPAKGNYKGQVGYINYSRWGFSDYTTKSGSTIKRDDELFRAIGLTCRYLGLEGTWWEAQDGKYQDVDALLQAFITERPWAGVWFHACVGGRQYMNGKYLNYELIFPKQGRHTGVPFSLVKDKVMTFLASEHIEYLKATGIKTEPAGQAPATSEKLSTEGLIQDELLISNEPVQSDQSPFKADDAPMPWDMPAKDESKAGGGWKL